MPPWDWFLCDTPAIGFFADPGLLAEPEPPVLTPEVGDLRLGASVALASVVA
jgi:hypothetical protein